MLQEGLEFKGPAPIPPSIAEHPLFKDRYKGRKVELFSLASGILNKAIDRWQRFSIGFDLTKTEEMLLSEANPDIQIRGEDTVRLFYEDMEPYEVFENGYGMFDGIALGVKNSIEKNLTDLIEDWCKKQKGVKRDTNQSQYEKLLYLASRLGLSPKEFLLDGIDEALELMGKVAEVIAILHLENTGEEISSEDFAAIANSSFPIVERLSRVNIEKRPTFVEKAIGPRDWEKDPKTDYFELKTKDGITFLTLSPLGQFVYERDGESESNLPFRYLFVSVDGNSPAEKLWHWMVDFLKEEEYTDNLVSWQKIDQVKKSKTTSPKVNV